MHASAICVGLRICNAAVLGDRLCRLCKDEIENEMHFMLQCPVYETLRQMYLPRKYCIFLNVN